ncbi:NAD(P)-dependent oxidoreductase [Beijerinckia mobilis]|uniref:NAD(P)-dependent oxidoreductase n=1 Tax=Beijerinckia mobilis TaxID=231434 RepID=UPI000554B8EF|nr:NAD(P)-dependent oxidoreductase [Beijerinckia mobilis]
MNVGFVGLGAMGHAMAQRLLDAKHTLTVYNRTTSKVADLISGGAHLAPTPADAARGADVVFSMLLDDHTVEEMTFGEGGIAAGLDGDTIHVCSSTISLKQAERLKNEHAERRQNFVTATVLGRPPAAIAGDLYVLLGGAESLRKTVTPLLQTFGQRIFVVGEDPVHANLVKLSLNFMIMSTIEQMSEVFAINEKAGVAPETIFEIMINSFYTAPVHKNYGKIMVEKNYKPTGAPMAIGLKDTELFLQAGHDLNVPLPYASVVRDRFLSALAVLDKDLDFAAILERVREDAGLPREV